MAEKSGLFNAVGGVPSYNDVDMATMFSLLTGGQGYLVGRDNELKVTAGTGLEVIVDTGAAWIGEPTGWWYINDEAKHLTLDAESDGFSRIDRVVLRLDRNTDALKVSAVILKGNPAASNPVASSLTQDSMVYELSLAQVLVTGGSTAITVTDERTRLVQSNLVFTLADCGLTDANFVGKTWEQCASLIVGTCSAMRVVQYTSVSSYPNLSTALVNAGLPSAGTLRFEAGTTPANGGVPNKFEFNGNNNSGIFVGFQDDGWRGWKRLDSDSYFIDANITIERKYQNSMIRAKGALTITIDTQANYPVTEEEDIVIMQWGDEQITLSPATGVSILSLDGNKKSNGKYSAFVIRRVYDDAWVAVGNLTP